MSELEARIEKALATVGEPRSTQRELHLLASETKSVIAERDRLTREVKRLREYVERVGRLDTTLGLMDIGGLVADAWAALAVEEPA